MDNSNVSVEVRNTVTNKIYVINNIDNIQIENTKITVTSTFDAEIYITCHPKLTEQLTNSIAVYPLGSLVIDETTLENSICDIRVYGYANVTITNSTVFGKCYFKNNQCTISDSTIVFDDCKIETDANINNSFGFSKGTFEKFTSIDLGKIVDDNETAIILSGNVNIESIPELSLDDSIWNDELYPHFQQTIEYDVPENVNTIVFKACETHQCDETHQCHETTISKCIISGVSRIFINRRSGFEFTMFIGNDDVTICRINEQDKPLGLIMCKQSSIVSIPCWTLNKLNLRVVVPNDIQEVMFIINSENDLEYHHNECSYGALKLATGKQIELIDICCNW